MANPFSAVDASMFWIKHSVGKGGSNRHDDVQMIQLMLNVAHVDPQNSFRMPSLLLMDGICGSRTLGAILAYQEHKMKWGGQWPLFAADGLVNAHKAVFMDAHHFGYSTLYNLNWDFVTGLSRVNFGMLMGGYFAEPLFSTVVLPLQKAGAL